MDQFKARLKSVAIVLATVDGDKLQSATGVTADRVAGATAGDMVNFVVQQVAQQVGGEGDLAMADGNRPQDLAVPHESVAEWVGKRA